VLNDQNLKIEGMTLKRGQREQRRVPAAELADGTIVELPLLVLRGREPGPICYVGAAFHGDEVAGVEIVGRLSERIDCNGLRGTLLVVPVQNPLAFQVQHRFFVGHMLKSPMDQNPADPWASFPGDPNGNLAAIIAHTLFDQLMRHAQYMIDIHTPTTGGRYAPFAFLPPTRCGDAVRKAEELARSFGADYILANDKGMYVGDKCPHTILGEKGIPAFGVEIGEGGRLDEEDVSRGLRGLINFLKKIEMLPGAPESFGRQMVMRTMDVIRARRGGIVHLSVGLNDDVNAGQVVATITNPFGQVIEEIRAASPGPVVRISTFSTVTSGERVVQLGVPR
jgi:predicted deacylase